MSLPCPACGERTKVVDTRSRNGARTIKRRRTCDGCGNRFSTAEERRAPDPPDPKPPTAPLETDPDIRADRNREIRRLYASGELTQAEIADAFGMTPQNVSYIVRKAAS